MRKKKVLAVNKFWGANKMMTFTIPVHQYSYMCLYCLAKSKSKSKIVGELVDSWYMQAKLKEPQEKLAQDVIEYSIECYNKLKKQNPDLTLLEFKDELRKELVAKILNPMQINVILKGIDNGTH